MLSYGHQIAPEGDEYVAIADKGLSGLAKAGLFGTYLVDYFPFCEAVSSSATGKKILTLYIVKHIPTWMPGSAFKRQAAEWRQASRAMLEMPFEMVKDKMVATSIFW